MPSALSLFCPGLLVVFLAFGGPLAASELPAPLSASIAQISPGSALGEVTPFEEAGETLYLVDIPTAGTGSEREWILDGEGVPIGVEVFEKELPPALRATLSAHLKIKGTEISDVVKIFEEGRPLFEVELIVGKESKVMGFYSDGRPAYTEVGLSNLPKPLRQTIKQFERTEGALESILHLSGGGPELYQIEIKRPGKPLWITLNASGAMVKREEPVTFKNTPEPVQAAILSKAGSAEHLRILLRRAGEALEFEVSYLREAKLHTLRLLRTGESDGPPLEALPLP